MEVALNPILCIDFELFFAFLGKYFRLNAAEYPAT